MSNDNPKKTPSADEIIEALALEMGVDDTSPKPSKGAKPENQPPPPPTTPPRQPAVAREPQAVAPARPTPPEAVAVQEKAAPSRKAVPPTSVAVGSAMLELQKTGLDRVFSLSDPGDPLSEEGEVSALLDEDEEPIKPTIFRSTALRVIIVLVISVVGLAVAYLLVPSDKRQDVLPLLQGEDIQTQRQERRRQEAERIRREWLAQQPKYGRLSVATRPSYGLIRVDGEAGYVRHPARAGALVETRSPAAFENLDVREHHVVYVSLPNYQEERIELFPYDHAATRWFQDQDTGAYYLELNQILEPTPEAAAELALRLNPSSMIPELIGEITVRTEPPGAMVYYNNTLLTDDAGRPLLTPVTFSDYPPRPATEFGAQPTPMAEQAPPTDTPEVPQEPQRRPITLSFRGVPLRVEMEGYLALGTGIYSHMYSCQPVEGVAEEAPFWEKCRYTYDTGALYLLTPEEFEPVEQPPVEGTNPGAAQADQQTPG
ncbi:MAG: hypothetical protein JW797_11825 [Bradymonadales bacterium]|nr:hypothetical protein [Bradymonadales bacterium]